MSFRIEGCTWEFKVQCPLNWAQLVSTDDEDVRVCEVCLRNVYRCHSEVELERHAQQGHCVAIQVSDEVSVEDEDEDDDDLIGLLIEVE